MDLLFILLMECMLTNTPNMKKLTYLTALLLVFAACKTSKTSTQKEKPLAETTLDDFISVMGITKNDLEPKAIELWGNPSKTTKDDNTSYSFVSVYHDDADGDRMFSYTYDKKTNTVNHIRLTGNRNKDYASTKEFFAKQKIKDNKINFLGMHKDEILKIFGTPTRVNSGNYEFVKGPVNVTFICYDFHQQKCSEIYVFWNMYWKG